MAKDRLPDGVSLFDRERNGFNENLAVRAFLSAYQCNPAVTVALMKSHMEHHGFNDCWPDWVTDPNTQGHLTKQGAQSWLRYLFALEN